MKHATILNPDSSDFAMEYDNNLGKKNHMRLDAGTYEKAIREAKSYLGINEDDCDEAGDRWTVE